MKMRIRSVMTGIRPTGHQTLTQVASIVLALGAGICALDASQLYDSGNPTNEEQYILELINRARANPAAEGQRLKNPSSASIINSYNYFGVNRTKMANELAAIAPAPPLAMSKKLLASSRGHSTYMLNNQIQSHTGAGGSSVGQRISAQSYNWWTYGENVYAYCTSAEYAHAGFEVDWGFGSDGMQSPRGHRDNIHSANFREVGIGLVNGSNGPVGPKLVTQDFATQQSSSPFLVGVVYVDANGNSFYDIGEGVAGAQVDVTGAQYYAVTGGAGGYAIPLPSDGAYQVTFSVTGSAPVVRSFTVSGNKNVKVDLKNPASTGLPPASVIDGPDRPQVNVVSTYTFTPVAGAVGHKVSVYEKFASTRYETAENGLGEIEVASVGTYPITMGGMGIGRSIAFHLANPNRTPGESFTLTRTFVPGGSGLLTFRSWLRTASRSQWATVQASADGGATWKEIWRLRGSGRPGQNTYSLVRVSLNQFAGQPILVRFSYRYTGGSAYTGTGGRVGWFVDNILLQNSGELVEVGTTDVPAGETSFDFQPTEPATYLLEVSGELTNGIMVDGSALEVEAVP